MLFRPNYGLISVCKSVATASQTRSIANYSRTQLKLNTGHEIPAIGFGTWQVSRNYTPWSATVHIEMKG